MVGIFDGKNPVARKYYIYVKALHYLRDYFQFNL